jgi:periplasmic protein TonB
MREYGGTVRGLIETRRGRSFAGAAISIGIHIVIAAIFALIVVSFEVAPPEFVELNIGRLTQQQLTRMIEQGERAAETSAPGDRMQTPQRRLPHIDMPAIRPTDVERRLLPDQVSLDQEKRHVQPVRPAGHGIPALESFVETERKTLYEGTQIDIGPRPGEGIESEHVGSDLQPVFLIEGDLSGRRFHEASITEVPDIPARTQVIVDVTVAPDGSIISAIIARKETASLEAFAVNFIRRSQFDRLPPGAPQVNQTGRITITFVPRPD